MNALTTCEPSHELFRAALQSPGSVSMAVADFPPEVVAATIEAARSGLVPIKDLDEKARDVALNSVMDALRPIGAKMMPLAGQEQCTAWLASVAKAMSDLPLRLVERAAEEAIHQVFSFPDKAEAAVRAIAQSKLDKNRAAIALLERMNRQAKSQPTPAIARQPQPWTTERVRSTPANMVKLGLAGGFIPQEIVDEAFPDGLPDEDGKMFGTKDTPND